MDLDLKILADNIGVSRAALHTWLGHYSLTKYVRYADRPNSKHKLVINFNKGFKAAFLRYIRNRRPKDITKPTNYFELRFKKFCDEFIF